jgi:hypothetical protein
MLHLKHYLHSIERQGRLLRGFHIITLILAYYLFAAMYPKNSKVQPMKTSFGVAPKIAHLHWVLSTLICMKKTFRQIQRTLLHNYGKDDFIPT